MHPIARYSWRNRHIGELLFGLNLRLQFAGDVAEAAKYESALAVTCCFNDFLSLVWFPARSRPNAGKREAIERAVGNCDYAREPDAGRRQNSQFAEYAIVALSRGAMRNSGEACQ